MTEPALPPRYRSIWKPPATTTMVPSFGPRLGEVGGWPQRQQPKLALPAHAVGALAWGVTATPENVRDRVH